MILAITIEELLLIKNLDVVALGGNAILPSSTGGTIREQFSITRAAMEQIVTLLARERNVVVTHGNGPIVGNIVIRNEAAKAMIPPMPLDVCGADSQGGIGYMIQQALGNALGQRGIDREVVTVVTQVVVSDKDPGFDNPVKPIGSFYSAEEGKRFKKERDWKMIKDGDRGYRRVVPSPQPLEIVEAKAIKRLVAAGVIVIAAGGGGIPVVRTGDRLRGREAVVDKDLTSALLGIELGAERFLILTDVDAVYRNFGTPDASPIDKISLDEIKALVAEGRFPEGSMGSKLRSVIRFLEGGGRTSVICRPENMIEAIGGVGGTTFSH